MKPILHVTCHPLNTADHSHSSIAERLEQIAEDCKEVYNDPQGFDNKMD